MKSNNNILRIAVALLLITNIALVIFMLKGKEQQDNKRSSGARGDTFEKMAKELDMTEQQKKEHLQFRDEYFKIARPLFDSVRSAKSAYFALVKDSTATDSMINAYNKRHSDIQFTIDSLTFKHFNRVRALYSGDQQKKYDEMVQKMMQKQNGRGNWKKDSTGKN